MLNTRLWPHGQSYLFNSKLRCQESILLTSAVETQVSYWQRCRKTCLTIAGRGSNIAPVYSAESRSGHLHQNSSSAFMFLVHRALESGWADGLSGTKIIYWYSFGGLVVFIGPSGSNWENIKNHFTVFPTLRRKSVVLWGKVWVWDELTESVAATVHILYT